MKIATVLTVFAAIVLVQAAPLALFIPRGESFSNTQAMEKRTPFDRPGGVNSLSGEHHVQHSDNDYNFKKRTFKGVGGTYKGPPRNIGSEGGSGGNFKKRHDPSLDSSTIGRTVKRAGGYNPSDPQGGYEGYEYGNDFKKRRDPSPDSTTIGRTVKAKRDGEYDP
ncbi:hypothetical protein BGZ47_008930 [Haplosporangium gracile]|nr:hypothetical protein BGZ47_008930 [Haplosporangium gracile]